MEKKCKKNFLMALFANKRASKKPTMNTSSSEGEKKDQGVDAAMLQSLKDAESK